MDIAGFLAARYDEDEGAARLAAREGGTWTQDDPSRYPGSISSLGGQVVYDEGSPDEHQAAHIARHDPARVLRQVEAGRKRLAEHAEYPPGKCQRCITDRGAWQEDWHEDDYPCRTLRIDAEVFADHPDYDQAWRPE